MTSSCQVSMSLNFLQLLTSEYDLKIKFYGPELFCIFFISSNSLNLLMKFILRTIKIITIYIGVFITCSYLIICSVNKLHTTPNLVDQENRV